MFNSGSNPHLGQFVIVSRGRDANQYAIIVRLLDERFVLLADGVHSTFEKPKKKNLRHLQLLDYVSPEVQSSITETGRVTNGKLHFALTKFLNERLSE
jgi:large subunit ribosomal protein L14e